MNVELSRCGIGIILYNRVFATSQVRFLPVAFVEFLCLSMFTDMTCAQEGHKTVVDGLVNFEKMHLFAQTIRTLRYSRSRHLTLEPPSPKSEGNVRLYISCLRVVDNQKQLMSLSQKLEPRRS